MENSMIILKRNSDTADNADLIINVIDNKIQFIYKNNEEFIFDPTLLEFTPDIAYLGYSQFSGYFLS